MARNPLRLRPRGTSGTRAGPRSLCASLVAGPALPVSVVLIMTTSFVSMPIDPRCMGPLLHDAHLPDADGLREQGFRGLLLIFRHHGLESGERRLDLVDA